MLDTIYVKYGLKINYILASLEHFDLNNDQDIKDL